MSLFKKTVNAAMLDLRDYTPQALEKIRFINAAIIILPEEAEPEFYTAYAGIRINAATTLRLPKNKQFTNLNGLTEINHYTENIVQSNGVLIIYKIETDTPIDIISNGILVYDPETKINFINDNGVAIKSPFEIEHLKGFSNKTSLNSQFFESLDDNTVIASGNSITIESDVEVSLLKARKIFIAAGNKIECSKKIIGYIQTISAVGNKIEAYD